jgi:hypothetical protein
MAMGAMLRWPRSGVAPSRLPAADRHCRVGVTKPQKVSCSHSKEVFAHFRKGDLTKHRWRGPSGRRCRASSAQRTRGGCAEAPRAHGRPGEARQGAGRRLGGDAEADEATGRALARRRARACGHARQGQGAPRRGGVAGRAGGSRLLLPSPPSLGARGRRERRRAPRGLAPEGREPRRRDRRRSPRGVRFARPETAQASGVEVPLGGLPLPVVALALRIRP